MTFWQFKMILNIVQRQQSTSKNSKILTVPLSLIFKESFKSDFNADNSSYIKAKMLETGANPEETIRCKLKDELELTPADETVHKIKFSLLYYSKS